MNKLVVTALTAFLLLIILGAFNPVMGQAPPPPDCVIPLNHLTGAGNVPALTNGFDNRFIACQTWTFQYEVTGFTAWTLTVQSSPGATSASGFVTYAGTVVTGHNPTDNTTGPEVTVLKNGTVSVPWIRVVLSGLTGSGTVNGTLYGYKTGYTGGTGSGGGGSISLTATSPIVVTPSPTTGTGVISCPTCGTGSGTINSAAAPECAFYSAATAISGSADCVENTTALAVPAAPTLTKVGAGTGTTWGYELVAGAIGGSPVALGSAASAEMTIDGNATLDMTHSITVAGPTCAAKVTSYDVYRTTASGTPSTTGLIGNIACGMTLSDTGLSVLYPWLNAPSVDYSVGIGSTLPYVNQSLGSCFGSDCIANNDKNFPFFSSGTGLTVAVRTNDSDYDYNPFYVNVQANKPGGSVASAIFDTDFSQSAALGFTQYAFEIVWNDTSPSGVDTGPIVGQLIHFGTSGTMHGDVVDYQGDHVYGNGTVTGNAVTFDSHAFNGTFLGDYYAFRSTQDFAASLDSVAGKAVAYYSSAMGVGSGARRYPVWFDETGVFAVNANNTFNSVYQAVPALYNPQFTKYTAGATNFERIILGQWESNAAYVTTEAGGTGTLRNIVIDGAEVDLGTSSHIVNIPASTFKFGGMTCTVGATITCM